MAKNNEYVKKRKSYYGFAKNYPGKLGSSKYVIGESKIVRRNETIRKIVIAIIIIFLFIASYVITTVGFNISNKEPNNNKTTYAYEKKSLCHCTDTYNGIRIQSTGTNR